MQTGDREAHQNHPASTHRTLSVRSPAPGGPTDHPGDGDSAPTRLFRPASSSPPPPSSPPRTHPSPSVGVPARRTDQKMLFQANRFRRWQGQHCVAFQRVIGGVLHGNHGSLFHSRSVSHFGGQARVPPGMFWKADSALRRNVWNPAPIDSCPAISWRQRDSDSL
jgi:hypothetical protein